MAGIFADQIKKAAPHGRPVWRGFFHSPPPPGAPLEPRPRHPLVPVAVALIVGIGAAMGTALGLGVFVAVCVFATCAAALVLWRKGIRPAFLLTLLAVACAGGAWTRCRRPLLGQAPCAVASVVTRVRGVVASLPELRRSGEGEESRWRVQFPLDVEAVFEGEEWRPAGGRVLVSGREAGSLFADEAMPRRGLSSVRYGERIVLPCRLVRPGPPRNPGEFDYGAYLRRNGLTAAAYVPDGLRVMPGGPRGGHIVLRLIYDAKAAMRRYVERNLDARSAALLRCLLLGERKALSEEQEAAYLETGTVHFLAVSGLHVGLLAVAAWWILSVCGLGLRNTCIVVSVLVIGYAVLGGLRPSIARAAVMAVTVLGAFILRRQCNFPNNIALAAIVVLLFDPADLASAGFQLSFIAVIGIAAFQGPIHRLFFGHRELLDQLQVAEERSLPGYLLSTVLGRCLAVSLAAWVAVAFLGAWHFNTVTVYTPAINLVVAPLFLLLLCVGFPAVLIGPIVPGFAAPFATVAEWLARALDALLRICAGLPASRVFVPDIAVGWVIAAYVVIGLAAFAPWYRLRGWTVSLAAAAVGATAAWCWALAPAPEFSVTALDVGEGSAVVIRLPGGGTLLHDCGSRGHGAVGERTVAPYLWHERIRRIDALLLSHADADHCNGLADVLVRFQVARAFVPVGFAMEEEGARVMALLSEHGVPVRELASGDRVRFGESTTMDVLHPPSSARLLPRLTSNGRSLVCRLKTDKGSVILPGDIEEEGIAVLLSRTPDARADVFVAPHHGLPVGNIASLLKKVRPEVILVSGSALSEGYPGDRWAIVRTVEAGATTVRFAEKGPVVSRFLDIQTPH